MSTADFELKETGRFLDLAGTYVAIHVLLRVVLRIWLGGEAIPAFGDN